MSNPISTPFLYISCQHGAESIIKQQWSELGAPFRIAYSSKGLLTFKGAMSLPVWSKTLPEAPLIRSRGWVLGKFEGEEASHLIDEVFSKSGDMDWQIMHVWQRDESPVGWRGFEPGRSELAKDIATRIQAKLNERADPRRVLAHGLSTDPQQGTPPLADSTRILEVILDTPNRWWLAAKSAQARYDRWPGGIPDLPWVEDVVSRAYYKIAEAFAWTGITIRPGERVVEIGSSPGGACQWLLEQGAKVTGVDPAEMDPRILEHPHFTHWQARSLQVKRRAFRPFRILVCDANVTPNYTLDTVESIVTYPTSNFRGLLLTMKLPEWQHAALIPEHVERIRSWGYEWVEARQLSHNRREVCLAARRRARKKNQVDSGESTPQNSSS
jgi:23S rRNA (cytidine2498-2'-O)-methyltransferase